jgi:hypothetical protein
VLDEPFHQVDVRLFGYVLARAFARRPSVIFRPPFKIEHAGPRTFDVPFDGLFVEGVELEEPIGARGLGQLFDPALGGLKIFFEGHEIPHVILIGSSVEPGNSDRWQCVLGEVPVGSGNSAVSGGLGRRETPIRCDVRPRVRSRLERFPQSLKGMAVKR